MKKEGKISILYLDDEENNLVAFKANFRTFYTVYTTTSADEAMKILRSNKINVVISDQRMPNVTGVQFFENILKEFPDPIRILLTGYADIQAVIEAINKGQVYRYITKPFVADDLKITIANAFEVYALREENAELMKKLLEANQQLEFMLRQRILSLDIPPGQSD
ncbi:MAG TPA: response regulator [Bacteroidia bacterium]|jgi:DNA-binding NtrC family response regulator|nr:response regulator [Bacteroidia bacterium]